MGKQTARIGFLAVALSIGLSACAEPAVNQQTFTVTSVVETTSLTQKTSTTTQTFRTTYVVPVTTSGEIPTSTGNPVITPSTTAPQTPLLPPPPPPPPPTGVTTTVTTAEHDAGASGDVEQPGG